MLDITFADISNAFFLTIAIGVGILILFILFLAVSCAVSRRFWCLSAQFCDGVLLYAQISSSLRLFMPNSYVDSCSSTVWFETEEKAEMERLLLYNKNDRK